MTRIDWTQGDFGAAMVRYVEAHAKHAKRLRDGGVTSEAFFRGGDNQTSLRVWPTGSWVDTRADGKGGAKTFAEIVAGMGLVDFMRQWGGGMALEAKPEKPKRYLSDGELAVFARQTMTLGKEAAGMEWMERRGMIEAVPRLVEQRIASAVDIGAALPWWAKTPTAPWPTRHRIVVGLFNGDGELRNLHARRVLDDVDDIKTASAAGVTTSGLVMADRTARSMLRGAPTVKQVHITEGMAAYLAAAGNPRARDHAVFGVLSGGWCEGHAAKVPDKTRITLDVDHDKAGDQYTAHILSTFAGRDVEIVRLKRTAA